MENYAVTGFGQRAVKKDLKHGRKLQRISHIIVESLSVRAEKYSATPQELKNTLPSRIELISFILGNLSDRTRLIWLNY